MYAKKNISVESAIAIALDLGGLNPEMRWTPEMETRWKKFDVQDHSSHEWSVDAFSGVCHGLDGLMKANLLHLRPTQEIFDTGMCASHSDPGIEMEIGLTYRGQFTDGRYICVYRTTDGQHWVEAETGTDRASRYFASFRCIKEHLPTLAATPDVGEVA
jgi:hypothetical protein